MDEVSPRLWLYNPNTSPLPLTDSSYFYSDSKIQNMTLQTWENGPQNLDDLRNKISQFMVGEKSVVSLLEEKNEHGMKERFPILLLGELANPWALSNLRIGSMPIFRVVIDGLCRVWSDGLDSRHSNPGVHHVTLARSENWRESTFLGFATKPQMKKMFEWLDNGMKGSWKPAKIGEGIIRLHEGEVPEISSSAVTYDGEKETVANELTDIEGSILELNDVFVPLHTRRGSYNNRGKLARVQHINQRNFHQDLFRRGSSFVFDEVLDVN